MINNILEYRLPKASFTKIIEENNEITFNPKEIQEKINNHFEHIFRQRTINQSKWSQWSSEYSPINTIDPNWYNQLLSPITETEIITTINNLPTNKAPGPSGITYNFIKQTSKEILPFLLNFFNQIIETGETPEKWSYSNIYPISKKQTWTYNLNETRPIALLDSFRKIFTKILTKRLGNIFSNNPILSPLNFAGLPNQSTFEPIQILNSIYNKHKLKNEELWILSLDISSAFDSVNLDMLKKSMERLKLPNKFIEISLNILQTRETKIINEHGPSRKIQIKDGIDQGDSISPLWWIIFYDPLISKLEKTTPNKNLKNALAYMDDLNLLANSKPTLQKLTNITTDFFELNDIKANHKKTKLITTNKKEKTITLNNTLIIAQHPTTPIRILGIWLSEKSILKPNRIKITEEITHITKILKRKYTTGAMATYLYNKVLLPRIEFKLQTTFFTSNMFKKIQGIKTPLLNTNSILKELFQILGSTILKYSNTNQYLITKMKC